MLIFLAIGLLIVPLSSLCLFVFLISAKHKGVEWVSDLSHKYFPVRSRKNKSRGAICVVVNCLVVLEEYRV